ncbi:hypothetical protein ABKN59_001993 [Abortiporus biennis]
MSSPSPTLQNAQFPFDSLDADVLLCTTDGVSFRVHKAILRIASTHFNKKFKTRSADFQSQDDDTQIVCVEEDSRVLDLLLRHLYPVPSPDIQLIGEAFTVLEAARKYEIPTVVDTMKATVFKVAQTNPLRVYTLAAIWHWEDEMRIAAKASLNHALSEVYVPELESIDGGTYYRLLAYHRLCSRVAIAVTGDITWMLKKFADYEWEPTWLSCRICPVYAFKVPSQADTDSDSLDVSCEATAWFHRYILNLQDYLRLKPCSFAVDDPAVLDPCLVEATSCPECRKSVLPDIRKFSQMLRHEIDSAVSEVELEIRK